MKALHPDVIRWIEYPENENVLHKIIQAEKIVGPNGEIKLIYHQCHVENVCTQSNGRV